MNVADHTTEFDRWLESYSSAEDKPPYPTLAMKNVADMLHGAWLAVQCEFGEKAQPEHAISLLGFALSEGQRLESTVHAGVEIRS